MLTILPRTLELFPAFTLSRFINIFSANENLDSFYPQYFYLFAECNLSLNHTGYILSITLSAMQVQWTSLKEFSLWWKKWAINKQRK